MRNFKITKKDGEFYNAEVTDSYGNKFQNYFEHAHEANDWVHYIWKNEAPAQTQAEKDESLSNAIWGCIKLDEKLGLLKGNRDNLD